MSRLSSRPCFGSGPRTLKYEYENEYERRVRTSTSTSANASASTNTSTSTGTSASASISFLGLESFMADSSICSNAEIHVFVNDC